MLAVVALAVRVCREIDAHVDRRMMGLEVVYSYGLRMEVGERTYGANGDHRSQWVEVVELVSLGYRDRRECSGEQGLAAVFVHDHLRRAAQYQVHGCRHGGPVGQADH